MPPSVTPPFPDDEHNPYAPPRSDPRPDLEPYPAELRPMEFSINDVLSRSWEIYKDRMGICIGVVIGVQAINFVAQMGLQAAQQVAPMARNPEAVAAVVGILGPIALMVFQLWLSAGQAIALLSIGRGSDADFSDVFSGGPYLFRIVVASILFGLMMVPPVLLGTIPGGIILATQGRDSPAGLIVLGLGVIAALVVAAVLAIRFSQYFYMIIDRDCGVIDSLRLSFELTRGKAGLIFVIYLLTSVINLAGLLACFIGLVFTLPLSVLLLVVTFLALTGQAAADPYAKGEPMADLEPL